MSKAAVGEDRAVKQTEGGALHVGEFRMPGLLFRAVHCGVRGASLYRNVLARGEAGERSAGWRWGDVTAVMMATPMGHVGEPQTPSKTLAAGQSEGLGQYLVEQMQS